MNMLLHGIRGTRTSSTMTRSPIPGHTSGGELRRFDRVITNPPFSQNYDKASLTHTERFRYGYTPEGGKKADLMFLQHMLAVLKKDGIVATVMPHGVLFRSGTEATIRRRIIEDDLLDTVIGLGPNLFYGTGIPAAVLILRAKGSKPPSNAARCCSSTRTGTSARVAPRTIYALKMRRRSPPLTGTSPMSTALPRS